MYPLENPNSEVKRPNDLKIDQFQNLLAVKNHKQPRTGQVFENLEINNKERYLSALDEVRSGV